MKLVTFRTSFWNASIGIFREDLKGVIDLTKALEIYSLAVEELPVIPTQMLELLSFEVITPELLNDVEQFLESRDLVFDILHTRYELLPPIPRPGAIYALGRNYPAHARESGHEPPKEPIVFSKAPTAVVGPDHPVVYKDFLTRVDPEAELAVIIGYYGSDIPVEEAMSYVAGYTCLNDVTARDLQYADLANSHPWLRSKGIDTFCPMGPYIVTPDELPDPLHVDVELRVNGETRQKDNTRSMTFDIPFLISWISRYHCLYPGDVITTGTPEGMQPVEVGDTMEVIVEGVGTLRNQVMSEEDYIEEFGDFEEIDGFGGFDDFDDLDDPDDDDNGIRLI